jgi:succinate dehydrogenase (ubiquinone) cytochrome b560 subunit
MTVISSKSAEEYKKQNYTERQDKLGRPVSPHVMIYAFPIVALSSITVRITGVVLSLGMSGIGTMALLGGDPSALMTAIGGSSLALPAKFCVAFPLSYHFIGGVRHAYWDAVPDAVTNEQVEKASYAVMGGAMLVTTGACMF